MRLFSPNSWLDLGITYIHIVVNMRRSRGFTTILSVFIVILLHHDIFISTYIWMGGCLDGRGTQPPGPTPSILLVGVSWQNCPAKYSWTSMSWNKASKRGYLSPQSKINQLNVYFRGGGSVRVIYTFVYETCAFNIGKILLRQNKFWQLHVYFVFLHYLPHVEPNHFR